MEEIIEKLKKRIEEFKQSEIYIKYKPYHRGDVCAIEIAIALAELGHFHDTPIKECNEHWYNGSHQIANAFTGTWSDISDFYDKLATEVENRNFFRQHNKQPL